MAEQSGRQPFRFRIPWMISSTPTVPAPTASRAPTRPQPTQSTATVRPPFRLPGVAPPRSSSQRQVPPSTNAQTPSPVPAASRPSSPAKNFPSQGKAESQPTSPIKPSAQPQVASQPSSPVMKGSSQPQVPAKPASQTPIHIASSPAKNFPSQPQAPVKAESQPTSPKKPTAQPQVASQSSSPVVKGPSQPQVPAKPATQPSSPFRTTLSQPQTPARTVSQGQATLKAEAKPISQIQPPPQPQVASQPSPPIKKSDGQPETPAKSESQALSPTQTTPQYQVTSQPSSPSKTTLSQPEAPLKTTTPPSPSLKLSKPQNVSHPSSPSHTATKPQVPHNSPPSLTTIQSKRTSQPPSPSHVASQLEAPAQITSQPHSPLIHAPRSQLTTQAPMNGPSSARSSELPSSMMAAQQESSEPPRPYLEEARSFLESTHQLNLKKKLPSVSPAVTSGFSQYPAPKTEIKQEKSESKLKEEKEKSTIQVQDASKQMTTPGLRGASVSNIQPKDQTGTSEDDMKQHKKQEHTQEHEASAKVATGKETKRTSQNYSHANTEFHTSASQGEGSLLHKEIRDNISKFAHKMSGDRPPITSDENPTSVMTIAGENTGSTMHLGNESAKKESSIHIHRGYKLNQEDISEATTDGDNNARRRPKKAKTKEDTARAIYVNSNTQSVNNSLMMNSSLSERSPGVHVTYTEAMNEPTKSNRSAESIEARRADFNVTPSQKLTYEPTVKRRCLRGLFLDSSDSDPDKPRRHGCRYDCKEKEKGKENGNDR